LLKKIQVTIIAYKDSKMKTVVHMDFSMDRMASVHHKILLLTSTIPYLEFE